MGKVVGLDFFQKNGGCGLLDLGIGTAAALKIRQGHLLPPGAVPEEAALKKDLWTFAVFTLALLSGMAKPTVGQTVTLSDGTGLWVWNPWSGAMNDDPTVRWYRVAFSKEIDVAISESASLLLANLVVAPAGLAWLSSDANVFPAWLTCATGDKASAGILGQILDKARSLPSSALSAVPKAAVSKMQTEPYTQYSRQSWQNLLHKICLKNMLKILKRLFITLIHR